MTSRRSSLAIPLSLALVFVAVAKDVGASELAALLEYERNTIHVFEAVSPSVVNISNVQMRRSYYSFDVSEVPAGTGSGFVWDQRGHIVTNYHVIQDASRVSVSFKNGKRVPAKLVGVEPRKDIALLKVQPPKGTPLVPIKLARSSDVRVGQKAIAIGSPFGLDQTLTVGTVSALGRSIPGVGGVTIRDMIQTDASINPGNSGGPLLDSGGRLIGMNTVIFSESGSSAGIGFAVPADTIRRIVTQIIRFGRVRQPGIGISAFPDSVTARVGVQGVLIREVAPGGPAQRAGLRGTDVDRYGELALGDLIVAVNDEKIKDYDDLYNALEGREIGSSVTITVLREGKRRNFEVELIDLGDL